MGARAIEGIELVVRAIAGSGALEAAGAAIGAVNRGAGSAGGGGSTGSSSSSWTRSSTSSGIAADASGSRAGAAIRRTEPVAWPRKSWRARAISSTGGIIASRLNVSNTNAPLSWRPPGS